MLNHIQHLSSWEVHYSNPSLIFSCCRFFWGHQFYDLCCAWKLVRMALSWGGEAAAVGEAGGVYRPGRVLGILDWCSLFSTWALRPLGFQAFGPWVLGSFRPLGFQAFGHLDLWVFRSSGFWVFSLLGFQAFRPLGFWAFKHLGLWILGPLGL